MPEGRNTDTERVKQEILAEYQKGRKPKELSEQFGISVNTIKSWIKRRIPTLNEGAKAGADEGAEGAPPQPEDAPPKRGAPQNNKNAVGNSGGAPPGNKNNLRHGAYERVMGELLEEDEAEIFNDVGEGLQVEVELLRTLAALNAKEVRLIKRINQIKEVAAKSRGNLIPAGGLKSVIQREAGAFELDGKDKWGKKKRNANERADNVTTGERESTTSSQTVSAFDALNKLEAELDKVQGRKIKVLAEIERIRLQREQVARESGAELDDEEGAVHYPAIMIPDNGRNQRPKGVLMPQAGPQTAFMASKADIVIYGGAAGGGKTYALLMEALRHRDVPNFGGVIFRKNYTQITVEGGLWDTSNEMYSKVPGAKPGKSPRLHWVFNETSKLSFAHLERDDDLRSWQGSQIAFIGFDELTHFTKRQFLYMLSRNRSTCGVAPYMRATCNPDADSWVAEFIQWWWDPETGYPIPERSGQIRWMVNLNNVISWFPTREEAVEFCIKEDLKPDEAEVTPKSVTFIASSLKDNKILTEKDPGYISNLRTMTLVDMERLLKGNWKIKAAAGMYFRRTQVEMIQALPTDVVMWVRGWDLAATANDEKGDPAYTAGVLMGKRRDGRYVVADVINQRLSASEVRNLIKMTAAADKRRFGRVVQRLPQDPGQAGKAQAQSYFKLLAGYVVKILPESGSKETRAEPMASQWQAGNFDILEADWNEMYFSQLEAFPESKFKDMVDAGSSAFGELEGGVTYSVPQENTLSKESYWKGR